MPQAAQLQRGRDETTGGATIHRRVRFWTVGRQKVLEQTNVNPGEPRGRIPQVAYLIALAIRLEELIASGAVPNYAALAQCVGVSRAGDPDREPDIAGSRHPGGASFSAAGAERARPHL